jgi:hypothetical protein
MHVSKVEMIEDPVDNFHLVPRICLPHVSPNACSFAWCVLENLGAAEEHVVFVLHTKRVRKQQT